MFRQYHDMVCAISERAFGALTSSAAPIVFAECLRTGFVEQTCHSDAHAFFVEVLDCLWSSSEACEEQAQFPMLDNIDIFREKASMILDDDNVDEDSANIIVEPFLVLEEFAIRARLGEDLPVSTVVWFGLSDIFRARLLSTFGVLDYGSVPVPDEFIPAVLESPELVRRLFATAGALAVWNAVPEAPKADLRHLLRR